MDLSTREFLAGAAGGMLGIVVGQPLDLVKVYQQQHQSVLRPAQATPPTPHSARGTPLSAIVLVKHMLTMDGMWGLFRGLSYPLCSSAIQSAVMFQAYNSAIRYLSKEATAGNAANSSSGSSSSSSIEHAAIGSSSTAPETAAVPIYATSSSGSEGVASAINGAADERAITSITSSCHEGSSTTSKESQPGQRQQQQHMSHDSALLLPTAAVAVDKQQHHQQQQQQQQHLQQQQQQQQQQLRPALGVVMAAGAFSAVCQAWFMAPIELLKIRMQIQPAVRGTPAYRGPLAMARHVLAQEGVAGLLRGTLITTLRDMPSFGVYFWVYQEGGAWMSGQGAPVAAVQLLAGGAAGALAWASIYPLDVVKTRQQSTPASRDPLLGGWWGHAKELVKQGGWRAASRGMGATVTRAAVVNAATFFGYETALDMLSS